ncbi:MAG: RluA family pseudouridine synthase [Sphingobacteriia bacterium]|nr:RluA family pseudouridine synthase [Sphingobacteriia bacterium]
MDNILKFNHIILPSRERLDKILSELLIEKNISRSRIQKLINDEKVLVDNIIIKDPSQKFSNISEIVVNLPAPEPTNIIPKNSQSFDVIFEDEDLIVINKPPFVTVHPGAGNYQDTLVNELVAYVGDNLSGVGGILRPGIVHRLDKDTSGLMIIAKNDKAHHSLSNQLKTRELSRKYYALVYGVPSPKKGVITTQIARDRINRTKMKVVKSGGREAITEYKVIEIYLDDRFSLVECSLKTGRTHQIRVHMTHIGHSIIGDKTYGSKRGKGVQALPEEVKVSIETFKRQALHAFSLGFIHPETNEPMQFEIELNDDMKVLIETLKENV